MDNLLEICGHVWICWGQSSYCEIIGEDSPDTATKQAEANTKLDTVQFTAENIHKVIKWLKPTVTRDPEGYSPFLVKQLILLHCYSHPFYQLVKSHRHGKGLSLFIFKKALHRILPTTDLQVCVNADDFFWVSCKQHTRSFLQLGL